jgi:hypothetical protein
LSLLARFIWSYPVICQSSNSYFLFILLVPLVFCSVSSNHGERSIQREVPEGSKLQGAPNYTLWSYKVRTILQRERLWSVVDPIGVSTVGASPTTAVSDLGENSNTTTATPSSTSAPILATSASPTTTPLETQSDDDLRYRATRIIVLIVKDSIMPHIMNIIDSRRIWIKLCSLYQSSSMNRHLSLKSQLYSLKMKKKMYIFAMRMLVA